jgi:hypothetical protein
VQVCQASVLLFTQMNQPSPTAHSNVCMQNARPRFFERLHGMRHHSPITCPSIYRTLTLSHSDTYRCCAWRSPRAPKCTWRVSEWGTVCSKIIRSLYKPHHSYTLNPEPCVCAATSLFDATNIITYATLHARMHEYRQTSRQASRQNG